MTAARHVSAITVAIAGLLSTPLAAADSISREQCIDAHSRGQDAQAQGKITLARKLFLTCAQSSCPVLVQGDCARFVDDLSRLQSSLTFVARDAQGADLPDTAVYVDDNLVVTRLDDGKPYEVDPGRHTIRFTSAGKDYSITVVVGTGEKGRTVIATFTAINPPPAIVEARPAAAARGPAPPAVHHPLGARIAIAAGGAAVVTGAVLGVLGVRKVPSSCSISSSQCTAPPGDAVFDRAKSGMEEVNLGIAIGSIGVAAVAGGFAWYFLKATTEREVGGRTVTPMVGRDTAGIALSGHF
jgi:hypothetical protein